MKIFRRLLIVATLFGIVFVMNKVSINNFNNFRIEGMRGLISECFFPNHDTKYSEGYSSLAFLKIRLGMSEAQVLDILGEPLIRWSPQDSYIGFQYSESPSDTHYRLRQVYVSGGIVKDIIGYYYID